MMQRFGRGARNRTLRALCVILVEPKYLPKTAVKRKAKGDPVGAPPTKRGPGVAAVDVEEDVEDSDDEEDDDDEPDDAEDLHVSDDTSAKPPLARRGGKPRAVVDPNLLKFVLCGHEALADAPKGCRVAIMNTYFGNDKLGEHSTADLSVGG